MSDVESHEIIYSVGKTLKQLLWDDGKIKNLVENEANITLKSPAEMGNDHRLSIYLFRITENPYLKNQEMKKHASDDHEPGKFLKYPPVTIDLNYLITPRAQEGPVPESDVENIQFLRSVISLYKTLSKIAKA